MLPILTRIDDNLTSNQKNLIEVRDLKTHFFTDEGIIKAVDGLNLSIEQGQTLCVVGESGCGKSVAARSILRIVPSPGEIISGEIIFNQRNGQAINLAILNTKGHGIRRIRGGEISMIFQEPMSSLSPVHTIGSHIIESILLHMKISIKEARKRAISMLELVGIPQPSKRLDSYSYELSGGMRQRAMIAIALVCEPQLLIADEPTTALDVTTQSNILDLIADLQQTNGMSVLFITHDLGVVAEIADKVVVMYLGQDVESGDVDTIFHDPKHPYTRALLNSIPKFDIGNKEKLYSIKGAVPHPFQRPNGCPYHPRCNEFIPEKCSRINPQRKEHNEDHSVRCLL